MQVMHLLLWPHRVVLQDAVLSLCDQFAVRVTKGAFFQSAEFMAFSEDLPKAMRTGGGTNAEDVDDRSELQWGQAETVTTGERTNRNGSVDHVDIYLGQSAKQIQSTMVIRKSSSWTYPLL